MRELRTIGNRFCREMPGVPRAWLYCLVSAALCFLPRVPSYAAGFDRNAAGTASVQSLKIAVDARGVALGEAFSALADGASAIDWNAAALIKIKRQSMSFMHSPYLAGSTMDFFAYAQNAGPAGEAPFGDVFISAFQARAQAAEQGHPVLAEVLFLAAHGTLQLLGYDDATARQRAVMFRKQARALPKGVRVRSQP